MRFFDFFAGIGGFRLGMEMAGHECVGHCEIDKYANKSYIAMHHPKESEVFFKDVRTISPWDMPECECYCFGFPCQSFSIAGRRGGFQDTRGTLFFEVMRLAEARHPKILFAENVKGLLNHDGGATFGTIIRTMDELGYDVEWQLLNSRYWVPQNRERVFIVGHSRREPTPKVFPIIESGETASILQGYGSCGNPEEVGGAIGGTQAHAAVMNDTSPALATFNGAQTLYAEPIAPSLNAGDRRTRGIFPTDRGGAVKVNGYHKRA